MLLKSEGADAREDGTGRGVPMVASPITAGYAKGAGVNDGKKGSPQNLILPGMGVRRLMPVECERLQSFPDDYVFRGFPNDWYQQIGNAVPVKLAEAIAKELIKYYE